MALKVGVVHQPASAVQALLQVAIHDLPLGWGQLLVDIGNQVRFALMLGCFNTRHRRFSPLATGTPSGASSLRSCS